jgi:hypothetical protein
VVLPDVGKASLIANKENPYLKGILDAVVTGVPSLAFKKSSFRIIIQSFLESGIALTPCASGEKPKNPPDPGLAIHAW